MASPFRIFRRHQKALLIVAGVILMLTFVLADSLQLLMGDSYRGANGDDGGRPEAGAVAVSWDGGKLTNAELGELVQRRQVLNGFLGAIYQQGAYAEQLQALTSSMTPRQRPNVDFVAERTVQQQGVESDVVRVRLFADAARKLGMKVSDEMIGAYLDELSFGRVSRAEMKVLTDNLYRSSGVTVPYLFDALREELLAQNYEKSHMFAISTVMPAQKYQDWLRVNDRVSVEAAPFPAEQFVVDVPEPTDEQLKEYYELYKEREPQPDFSMVPELPSHLPGFRISRKLDVQYVKADFDAMLEKVKSELTEEEIQKYYDENKDPYYIKAETPAMPATETPAADEPARQTPATEPGTASEPAAEGEAKQITSPATTGDEQSQPAPTGDEKSSPTTPPADTKESASNSPQRSGTVAVLPVSYTQEMDAKAETATAQPAADGQTEQKTEAGTPALNQPATTDDTAKAATDGTATPATPLAEQKPKEFQSLDELRDKIRRLLATPKVHERLDELTEKLRTQLNTEFNKYFTAYVDAEAAKKPLPTPPATLTDLSALAMENGLEYRKTGEMTALQLRDDDVIGKLIDIERSNFQVQAPILGTLLSKDIDLYKPLITVDVDNNRYIIMKTSDTPGRTPPLDEIKADVVKAWKREKAAELAKKHAEEIAKKAEVAGQSLTDYFANDPNMKVIKTNHFSWLTSGDVPLSGGQLRLSEPEGIVAAGPAFMSAVFELQDGKVGSAQNHDRSIAYAVRKADHEMPEEKLRDVYLSEVNNWPGLPQMLASHRQSALNVLTQSVFEAANVDRKRPLDPVVED